MSASRRAPKRRYTLTSDRDRIAMVVGGSCGFLVLLVSAFVQRHQLLETIFRATVAMFVMYVAAHIVVWMVAYLRETQSIVPGVEDVEVTTIDEEVEEPKTE